MPEPSSQLQEQLETLLRTSVSNTSVKVLHDDQSAKVREPSTIQDVAKSGDNSVVQTCNKKRRKTRSGVLSPRGSSKSYTVNIRPNGWGDKDKIWYGKFKTKEGAQRIADIVFNYLGNEPVHFPCPNSNQFPPFLNRNLRPLANMRDRMKYVMQIAKGEQYESQRKELLESVKEMVDLLTVRQEGYEFVGPIQEFLTSTRQNQSLAELSYNTDSICASVRENDSGASFLFRQQGDLEPDELFSDRAMDTGHLARIEVKGDCVRIIEVLDPIIEITQDDVEDMFNLLDHMCVAKEAVGL